MRKLVTMLAFLLVTAGVSEALSLQEYIKRSKSEDKNQRQAMNIYVLGLGEGLFWANIGMKEKHNVSLFCLPKNLPLAPSHYSKILNEAIDKYKETESIKTAQNDDVLGLLLLTGLEEHFPCGKQ